MSKLSRRMRILLISFATLLGACSTVPHAATPPATGENAAPSHLDLPRVELTPDVLYDILLGEIAGHRGQVAVAASVLGRAAQKTRDPRLAQRATAAGLYSKRYADALRSAQLWVDLQPQSTNAREALATVLLELGDTAQAQTQLEVLLTGRQAQDSLEVAYQRVSTVLGRHSNRTVSIEIMQNLVDEHPREPAAQFALAHLAVRAGELDKAEAAVSTALDLRPEWEDAALFKARVLVSQKDTIKAQSFYEEFLGRYPAAANMRLNYARYLIDQKQWEKARTNFLRVVSELPEDIEAIYALGLLSLQTNHIDDAEQYLKRTLELQPRYDQARLYLGQVAEQRKQYDQAVEWYGQVQPGEFYFEAQMRLGVAIARQGDIDAARRHLHGLRAENNQQRVQLVLTEEQMLREAKQFREALKVLSAALSDNPREKDLLYARALTAEKLNMLELVESDLRTILKDDPKHVNAMNALGYTLADRTNRYEEAKRLLQQAVSLKPEDPFILDSMGWLYFRMGKSADAIKYLKRALEMRPDAEIAAHLGEVLWVTGNRNEAETVWDRALRDTPDNEALLGVIKKFKP